jgi:hypothetical protein
MNIPLALLADAANVSSDGKLNILGTFDVIYVARFPAIHPQMQLVFTIEANPAEAGVKRTLEIKLMAEDGQQLVSLAGELALEMKGPMPSGEMLRSSHIVGLQNVSFKKPGSYQFAILVNADVKATVGLKVQERTVPSPA